MLKFVNIDNGELYSGQSPYIHWFEEGQSVNINYVKEIVFISDLSSVYLSIEDNPYFKLMQFLWHNGKIDINNFSYYNINDFLCHNILLEGIPYNGNYLYRFFVYAFSQDTGQYTADIYLQEPSVIKNNLNNNPILSTITIGADFYPDNELLTNDLENLGIEIPAQIQKAIYESNVHEESTDNILMNRKWKELLLEYWNIVANKGSYRSLINSMKFFEYGDLIKIMEFWKVHYNKDIFISNDLEQILNDRFRESLSAISKSTYIGLYLALEKINSEKYSGDGGDYVETDFDLDPSDEFAQDNPLLDKISTIWSAEELALKMTLVGNFFSTYFMPLHLDLIHSTIENIVFSNTLKILNSGAYIQRDYIDTCGNFLSSVKEGENYYIKPQNVYVTQKTILGYKEFDRIISDDTSNDGRGYDSNFDSGGTLRMKRSQDDSIYIDEVGILGIDEDYDTSYLDAFSGSDTPWDVIFSGANVINKFGAIVPIDVKIVSNVSSDDYIKAARIHWVRDGKYLFNYNDNGVYITPIEREEGSDHYMYNFDFKLLFQNPGNYKFYITFISSKSFEYSREFSVNILDDADNPIHIYKVEREDIRKYKDMEIQVTSDNVTFSNLEEDIVYEINEFSNSQVYQAPNGSGYQYICADLNNMQKNTGLNHVIIFKTNESYQDARIGGSHPSQWNIQSLKQAFPYYWWFERNVSTDIDKDGTLNSSESIIIGIRKYFSIKGENPVLFDKNYSRGIDVANVKIIQKDSMMVVTVVASGNYRSYAQSYKINDCVEVEVLGHKMNVRVFPDYNYIKYLEEDRNPLNNKLYGDEENRIVCEGHFTRLVNEDRFIPMFHKLVKVDESNCEILPSELMITIPELKRTYTDYTDVVWEFLNSSTMESITSYKTLIADVNEDYIYKHTGKSNIDFFEPLIGKFEPRILKPGYYNINLNYKYAGIQHKESRDAAFKIRKDWSI